MMMGVLPPTFKMRELKMFGDMMHMVAYPCLFWALRRERQIGVSLNSQILFFLSLLFRYATLVTETSEMLGTMTLAAHSS